MIPAVDVHADGLPGRVITGVVGDVPGRTTLDKARYLEEYSDDLRKLMLREPRGYPGSCCNLVLPSNNPAADYRYVIMEHIEYPGHVRHQYDLRCHGPHRDRHGQRDRTGYHLHSRSTRPT